MLVNKTSASGYGSTVRFEFGPAVATFPGITWMPSEPADFSLFIIYQYELSGEILSGGVLVSGYDMTSVGDVETIIPESAKFYYGLDAVNAYRVYANETFDEERDFPTPAMFKKVWAHGPGLIIITPNTE